MVVESFGINVVDLGFKLVDFMMVGYLSLGISNLHLSNQSTLPSHTSFFILLAFVTLLLCLLLISLLPCCSGGFAAMLFRWLCCHGYCLSVSAAVSYLLFLLMLLVYPQKGRDRVLQPWTAAKIGSVNNASHGEDECDTFLD
jgi:hypothetical protein